MILLLVRFLLDETGADDLINSKCTLPENCFREQSMLNINENVEKSVFCHLSKRWQLNFTQALQFNKENNCSKMRGSKQRSGIKIKPLLFESSILNENSFDFVSFIEYVSYFQSPQVVEMAFVRGFTLNVYESLPFLGNKDESHVSFTFRECSLDFRYDTLPDGSRVESCQDIFNANSSTNLVSIFELLSKTLNANIQIVLNYSNRKICPLVFRNFQENRFDLTGYDSFYSKESFRFSNESLDDNDVNSNIYSIVIKVFNASIDFWFLNRLVFKSQKVIEIKCQIS